MASFASPEPLQSSPRRAPTAAAAAPPAPLWQRLSRTGLALALAILFLRVMVDYDIFYHLSIGREVWALGSVPVAEFYLWEVPDQPIHFYEWGFGLLAYAAWSLGGWPALAVLNAALSAATLMALWSAAGQSQRLGPIAALLLLVVALLMAPRMVYRPEQLLYLALALALLAAERARATGSARPWWLIPPIAWFLMQGHPSALFLFAVAGILALAWLISRKPAERGPLLLRLLPIGAAALLAALANPYGWEALVEPLHFVQQSDYLSVNAEFQPVFAAGQGLTWVVAMVLGAAGILLMRRKDGWGYGLLLLLFGWQAFAHVRNLALLSLIIAVPILIAASRWERSRPAEERLMQRGLALFAYAAVGLGLALAGQLGTGPDRLRFDQALAERLAQRPAGSIRLFNELAQGGWLAWTQHPQHKIYIDGRHYRINQVLERYSTLMFAPDAEGLAWLDQAGITHLWLEPLDPLSRLVPLIATLSADPRWRVAEDGGAVLLWERTPPDAAAAKDVEAERERILRVIDRILAGRLSAFGLNDAEGAREAALAALEGRAPPPQPAATP